MPATAPRIEWDTHTLTLVAEGGWYGRIRRVKGPRLICAYEHRGGVRVSHSADNGKSWKPGALAARIAYGHAANPELLVTRGSGVLLFVNERPSDGVHPFAISMARSTDGGQTWSDLQVLYAADTRFENGCWEPAAVQMPDGEIRVVFANESPYRETHEQEISMMVSRDGGQTWSPLRAVSFRPRARDGMPVPALLGPKREMHVAIEDSGLSGLMKPVIVRVGDALPVSPGSPDRWAALAEQPAPEVNVAAPYLVAMPTGVTVLSSQSSEGGRKPRMVVYLGDRQARGFGSMSEPFAMAGDADGMWNSLFVKSRNVVTAVSSTVIEGKAGVWSIDGRIRR